MDKQTTSNYGWVIVTSIVLAIMIVLATPFGSYIGDTAKSTLETLQNKTVEAGICDAISFDDPLDPSTETYALAFSESAAAFKIDCVSLNLESGIWVNYKVNADLFSEEGGYSDPYVKFTLNGNTTTVNTYDVENGYYVFRFRNVNPSLMNDTITSTLYATKDGATVTSTSEYSIATYCYRALDNYSSDERFRTVVVDLLNYGAASQVYTNHNTTNLVNAALTEEQKAWGTSETPTFVDSTNTQVSVIENPTVTWLGCGLRLADNVQMRYILSADDISGLTVEFTDTTGKTVYKTVESSDFEVRTGGGWYVYFDTFNAGQMSDVIYATVYKDGVAVSNTLSYSVESYAYAKQNSSIANLGDLVKAMMKYGNSAHAYIYS